MKAIRVHHYGKPEVLKLEDVPIEKPGPGQALVRNKMIGVNFVDIYQRKGPAFFLQKPPFIPSLIWNPLINFTASFTDVYQRESLAIRKPPYVPGMEGAGIVEEIGEGVTEVKPGDRVAYVGQNQAYAEMILVQADRLIPVPREFSFEQAAAFPLQGMTAHYLLHEFRKLKPEDVVLIHAAAGGMGLLLVQWARRLGVKVIGTVSSEAKAKAAKNAGAHEVINYTTQDFVAEIKRLTHGHGADLIIDGVGKSTFSKNLAAGALRGNIVTFGAASGPPDKILPIVLMTKALSISGGSLPNYLLTREETLFRAKAVIQGIQEGWLKLNIGNVLPLAEAAKAHRLLESRQTMGKVLLSTFD